MPPKAPSNPIGWRRALGSHLRSRSEALQKKVGRIPIAECAQPAQKKVYGFRDLLRSFSCSLAGDSTENDDVRVGIAAQTVCAVRDARHFTRSPESRDHLAVSRQRLRLFIDAHAAHRVCKWQGDFLR